MAKSTIKRIDSAATRATRKLVRKKAGQQIPEDVKDSPVAEFEGLFSKLALPLPEIEKFTVPEQPLSLTANSFSGASLAVIESELGPDATTDALIRETYQRVRRIELMLHKSTGNSDFMSRLHYLLYDISYGVRLLRNSVFAVWRLIIYFR